MIRMTPVFRVLGGVFLGLAVFMTPPLLYDLSAGAATASYFIFTMVAAIFAGATLIALSASSEPFDLTRRQAFLTTGLAWILAPAIGAIPLLGLGVSYVDAYFEAVSGVTTTGSTVLVGLDHMSQGILLWRSLLQWIGGIGFIGLGIVVMPFLRVGGMQLFQTESSDTSEKILAKSIEVVRWIAVVYLGLTAAAAVAYGVAGMSPFDAVNHAMTTLATGGYSTHDASFGYFRSPAIEWTGVVFMVSGALPFVAYIRTLRGRTWALFTDVQVRGFLAYLFAAWSIVAVTHSTVNHVPFFEAFRMAAFTATSIITTTGYANTDYQLWGPFAFGAVFLFTFTGGCSGSTTGGIKIYRFQILARLAIAHLTRLLSPSQVKVVTYSTRRVDSEIAIAIQTFIGAVLISELAVSIILTWFGVDLLTALTAAATAISNVGPGLGPIIGPAGNFASLPDGAKIALTAAMILGRLEYFTLLVMLTPAFWRD